MIRSIRVLADDLTGAAETAAQFTMLQSVVPVWWAGTLGTLRAPIQVYNSQSRDAAGDWARESVERFARRVTFDSALVYKRIDSLLRGPIALEIDALMHAQPFRRLVLAPATPALGRVTVGGRQYAASGEDWTPLEASFTQLLARLGPYWHEERRAGFLHRSARPVIAPDVASDEELDRLVQRYWSDGTATLWSGSTGLAAALARKLGSAAPRVVGMETRGWLAILGTGHPSTAHQVIEAEHAGLRVLRVSPERAGRALRDVPLGAEPVVCALGEGTKAEAMLAPERLDAAVRALVASIEPPSCALLSGGRTAEATLRAAGAERLHVVGALGPGLTVGRVVGGRWHGVATITKSGAYGVPALLVELAHGRVPAPPVPPRRRPRS